PGVVVDLARRIGQAAHLITCCTSRGRIVAPVGIGLEVTQVGGQRLVVGQRPDVYQAAEVLHVVVLELGGGVLPLECFAQLIVGAGEEERVALLGAPRDSQAGAVARATSGGVLQAPSGQRQAIELLGGDHAALEGLR